jgi:hypothetical protein
VSLFGLNRSCGSVSHGGNSKTSLSVYEIISSLISSAIRDEGATINNGVESVTIDKIRPYELDAAASSELLSSAGISREEK